MVNKSVITIIAARNEEKNIAFAIDSLLNQTIPPTKIIVVDDGSVDNTSKIVKKYQNQNVHLIIRKERIGGPSLLGTPLMAIPFNIGFDYVEKSKLNYDFIMISGADSVYEKNYVEFLIDQFEKERKLVVCSGMAKGEKINKDHVTGSGRIIRKSFWDFYGNKYPFPAYLWESGIVFKAQMLELKAISFNEVTFKPKRKRGSNIDMIIYGRVMKVAGYPALIVIGRAILFMFEKGLRAAIRSIAGYLMTPIQIFNADKEIREYLSKYLLYNKVHHYLLRIFK